MREREGIEGRDGKESAGGNRGKRREGTEIITTRGKRENRGLDSEAEKWER